MKEFSSTANGHKCWSAHCVFPRHRHAQAYVAVILSGGYEESGSRGRFRVSAGDVLLHDLFDAHLDRFQARGAHILNLVLAAPPGFSFGHVADVDAIARIAEHDCVAASALLREQIVEKHGAMHDWPDILAADLLADPNGRLDLWADKHNLAPETVSRGFGRVFAVTPAAFRAEARAKDAFGRIVRGNAPLAAVAASSGFADQAHMSRAVKALTGATPRSWRRSNPFKTDASLAA